MSYDIKVHLPKQVDLFLDAIVQGNENVLHTTLSNIKDIVVDETFHKDLDDYEKQLDDKIKSIEKKALETIKADSKAKTLDDVINTVNVAVKDVNTEYNEYIKTLKAYILGWVNNV